MDDEYIIMVRAPALTGHELQRLISDIQGYDNGDMEVIILPDEFRNKGLKLMNEVGLQ